MPLPTSKDSPTGWATMQFLLRREHSTESPKSTTDRCLRTTDEPTAEAQVASSGWREIIGSAAKPAGGQNLRPAKRRRTN